MTNNPVKEKKITFLIGGPEIRRDFHHSPAHQHYTQRIIKEEELAEYATSSPISPMKRMGALLGGKKLRKAVVSNLPLVTSPN
jgi:hypothetical protein